MRVVGGYGYSWASSVTTGTDAYHLYFHNGGLNPNYSYHRGHGLQLRCLQE
ncbi:MAG: hypothetical protein K2G93_08575 [Rikenella sp.]|nr:hypothetical protein [Rikenella sp.]